MLHAALAEAAAGRGRVVRLTGEPGIGKTRTAAEFADQARDRRGCVLWGACYDGEWAPPFGRFAEAIAAYARRCAPDTLRDDLGFGAAPIARVVPALRERLPDLPEPAALPTIATSGLAAKKSASSAALRRKTRTIRSSVGSGSVSTSELPRGRAAVQARQRRDEIVLRV